jgi:hypothetical protein
MSDALGRDSSESSLRLQLARGDAVVGSVVPVLRHLLVCGDQGLFGDDVWAAARDARRSGESAGDGGY